MSATRKAPMPRLARVAADEDHQLVVTWAEGDRDGRTETVDLAPLIFTLRFYRLLRENLELFKTVRLIDNGTAIAWGDGEIDMAATSVERLAEESMTNQDFRDWMSANKLSYSTTSAALGISRRMVAYYAKDTPIPRYIALACQGYEAKRQNAWALPD